jgi:hypothetical protein
MFGVVSRNFVAARHLFQKTGVEVHTKHDFSPPEPFLHFSQRTFLIHYFRSKTHVWRGFAQFRCRTSPIPKTGVWVNTKHNFCHRNPFFVFCNEHAQSTTLCPKLMFDVVSLYFVAARHPFRKRVSGCIQSTSFATGTISSFFATNMLNPLFRSKTHDWGGFVQFRCRTSPIPKKGVRVHRSTSFCHRNHFFVLRNEHAQSTTLGPKLMFGVVSRNFVAARQPFRKRVSGCIQSMSFRHQNHFFAFRNEHAQSTTLGPRLMFGVVSRNFVAAHHPLQKRVSGGVHTKHEFLPLEPFLSFSQRTCPIHNFRSNTHVWGGFAQFRCRTSPIPKTGVGCIQSMSFRHRNHFFVFCKEHAQSTTLGPKLILGWFRAISLSYVTHSQNGCRGTYKARVFATGTTSSFFATYMPSPLL